MNRITKGEESKETKVKKSLKISTDEKTTHTPKVWLLCATSGITGKKTVLENNRQAMRRDKVC